MQRAGGPCRQSFSRIGLGYGLLEPGSLLWAGWPCPLAHPSLILYWTWVSYQVPSPPKAGLPEEMYSRWLTSGWTAWLSGFSCTPCSSTQSRSLSPLCTPIRPSFTAPAGTQAGHLPPHLPGWVDGVSPFTEEQAEAESYPYPAGDSPGMTARPGSKVRLSPLGARSPHLSSSPQKSPKTWVPGAQLLSQHLWIL